MSHERRKIDESIVRLVAEAPVGKDGFVATRPIAAELEITQAYLRARLLHIRRSGALAGLEEKLRWRKKPTEAQAVIKAWRESATIAEVARTLSLSRTAVVERIKKLRLQHPDLRERPHKAETTEDRQKRLLKEIMAIGGGDPT